jgi:HD superfamily phosphodiesterase
VTSLRIAVLHLPAQLEAKIRQPVDLAVLAKASFRSFAFSRKTNYYGSEQGK